MRGSWPVEAEVGLEASGLHLVWNEVMEHQYVGLFDHLSPRHPLGSEQNVGGDGDARCHLFDDQRLEPREARELLVDPRHRVVAVDQDARRAPANGLARPCAHVSAIAKLRRV